MDIMKLLGVLIILGYLIVGAVLCAGAARMEKEIEAEMDRKREDEVRRV